MKLVTNLRDVSAHQVGCPYAQRSWLALELKKMPYERVEIDLRNKPEWFMNLSPLGRVPALVVSHHRSAIVESTVINEFLEDVTKDEDAETHRLLPLDPFERAQQRILVQRVDARFIPAGFRWLCYGGEEDSESHYEAWLKELQFWNQALSEAGTPFFGGNEMGLADVTLAPFVERLDVALKVYRQGSMRETCTEAGLEALVRWMDNVWATPEFLKTCCTSREAIAQVYEPIAVRGMSYLNQ